MVHWDAKHLAFAQDSVHSDLEACDHGGSRLPTLNKITSWVATVHASED